MKRWLIVTISLLVLGLAGGVTTLLLNSGGSVSDESESLQILDDSNETGTGTSNTQLPSSLQNKEKEPDKTFFMTAELYKFVMDGKDNPTLNVKEGDKVRIDLAALDSTHDFVVDELDVKTERVDEGESTYIEFVADKKGVFKYYCGVGIHRQYGMEGVFVVG